MITNRGVKVYPDGFPESFCTDHWRCRFVASDDKATLQNEDILELLKNIHGGGFDFIKTEHLYTFDGERGYSLGQGE
jgi:isocitrate dehydrogenase